MFNFLRMKIISRREQDWISVGVAIRFFATWAIWFSWATMRGDRWRDETGRGVKFGIINQEGGASKAKALVVLRLKLGFAWPK